MLLLIQQLVFFGLYNSLIALKECGLYICIYMYVIFLLCDLPSLSTCKLEILNGADPLSLASAIGN